MKAEIIGTIIELKGEIIGAGMALAALLWKDDPSYAIGAIFGIFAAIAYYHNKTAAERLSSIVFTFVAGAFLTPLLEGWSWMDFIPRPKPMTQDWRILGGFLVSLIAGVGLEFIVLRARRRVSAAARMAVDAAATRLGLPEAGDTTIMDAPQMSAAEFAEMLGTLPAEHRDAILAYRRRAADPARAATREKHLPRD